MCVCVYVCMCVCQPSHSGMIDWGGQAMKPCENTGVVVTQLKCDAWHLRAVPPPSPSLCTHTAKLARSRQGVPATGIYSATAKQYLRSRHGYHGGAALWKQIHFFQSGAHHLEMMKGLRVGVS